ncbi:hypothetical protein ACGIF2_04030 [Cellulomonas sp. P22]|uniref:hypothetical protein n=1 Tax=Cellulomonas sp. P22 TaxID=3373189 RepID=UPI00378C5624
MNQALSAEVYLQLRRRTVVVVASTVLGLVAVFVGFRFITSTADTGPAVQAATELAATLAAQTGAPIDPGATYAEPRYMFASQYPYDLAGATVAIALITAVGGAILAGGDWRTRAVGVTFPDWRRRARPAAVRIVVWAALSAVLTLVALIALSGLLFLTAALRGSTSGADALTIAFLVGRGAVLGGLGGLVGASAATVLRSDVLVVVAVLAYVLVVETLMPALLQNGWRTPGSRLIDLVISPDPGRELSLACDVPRCADPLAAGPGQLTPYLLACGLGLLLVLAGARAARRPIWT